MRQGWLVNHLQYADRFFINNSFSKKILVDGKPIIVNVVELRHILKHIYEHQMISINKFYGF